MRQRNVHGSARIQPVDYSEEWRPVAGGLLEVTKTGRLRKVFQIELTGAISSDIRGYRRVKVLKRLRAIHELVAEAFLGPRPTGLVVNHKDGNKLNNSVENLEYVTRAENTQHAWQTGLCKQDRVRLSESDVREIRAGIDNAGYGDSVKARVNYLARKYSVGEGTIANVIYNQTWKWVN